MKKLLILLIALLLSGEGWGATAYVLPTGSNTSPYDAPAKAANAINTAVTYLNGQAGPHNLYVGPGNYTDYPLRQIYAIGRDEWGAFSLDRRGRISELYQSGVWRLWCHGVLSAVRLLCQRRPETYDSPGRLRGHEQYRTQNQRLVLPDRDVTNKERRTTYDG